MKNIILSSLISAFFVSCFALPGEANTAFILKNSSVKPKDSVVARQAFFKKDSEKRQSWFSSFEIFPSDNIEINDPKLPENWKKSNKDKIQIYTFTLNK